MASRFLTRSKALAHAIARADAAASSPLAGTGSLRALSTLPQDPAATAAGPSPRQPSVRSPLDLSKILGYGQTSRLSGAQVLPRWFSIGASNGSSAQQVQCKFNVFFSVRVIPSTLPKTIVGMAQFDELKTQEGASTKVTAFSPLEATIAKPRSGPLRSESLKVRVNDIVTTTTYYMIPTQLLISKNSVSTSLMIMSVFHQIYMFHKEILLDYVHNEVTRKWALIYFKILLLIMAKDTIINIGLLQDFYFALV
ncbi:unnamed protein product [Urochloa decumbens]|uniref:Uncharacterized protein n=1 Tax=Urochloa decumbens TaxID=240449 RepID=A0ABC9A4H1_9POAL